MNVRVTKALHLECDKSSEGPCSVCMKELPAWACGQSVRHAAAVRRETGHGLTPHDIPCQICSPATFIFRRNNDLVLFYEPYKAHLTAITMLRYSALFVVAALLAFAPPLARAQPASHPSPTQNQNSSAANETDTILISSAADFIAIIDRHVPRTPLVAFVTGDLLFNATNWPEPIQWPSDAPSGSVGSPASAASQAGRNLTIVLEGRPLPINASAASDAVNSSSNSSSNSTVASSSNSTTNSSSASAPAAAPSNRMPRLDMADMDGRLWLAAGTVMVFRNLEVGWMAVTKPDGIMRVGQTHVCVCACVCVPGRCRV